MPGRERGEIVLKTGKIKPRVRCDIRGPAGGEHRLSLHRIGHRVRLLKHRVLEGNGHVRKRRNIGRSAEGKGSCQEIVLPEIGQQRGDGPTGMQDGMLRGLPVHS